MLFGPEQNPAHDLAHGGLSFCVAAKLYYVVNLVGRQFIETLAIRVVAFRDAVKVADLPVTAKGPLLGFLKGFFHDTAHGHNIDRPVIFVIVWMLLLLVSYGEQVSQQVVFSYEQNRGHDQEESQQDALFW